MKTFPFTSYSNANFPLKPSDTVRIETGVRQGDEVSVHYDPMIAKLVVWGKDRPSALMKLHTCLSQYNIDGLSSNVNFLMDLASHPEFMKGNVDTDFIPRHYDSLFPKKVVTDEQICEAALAVILNEKKHVKVAVNDPLSPFASNPGARFNHQLKRTLDLQVGGKAVSALVTYVDENNFKVQIGESEYAVSGSLVPNLLDNFTQLTCIVNGAATKSRVLLSGESIRLFGAQGSTTFTHKLPKFLSSQLGGGSLGDAIAPMPGVLEKVSVNAGDQVKMGDPLIVMIAMKMEYVIKAPRDGVVEKVNHKVGDFVAKNTLLVQMKEEEGEKKED